MRAVTPDGKPHPGATVRLDTLQGVQRWFSREKTDVNGELVAPVYAEESYVVKVFHYASELNFRKLEGSATVHVDGREASVVVVLQKER